MTEWTRSGNILTNDDDVYKDFLDKTGAANIDHYGLIMFGDPRNEDFLEGISVSEHVYSLGDTLAKIAYKQYGDARFWWLLAWFNTKPTDLHCELGEIIYAPHPVQEAVNQMFNRVEL